jgi:1,4-alpha-glucan branching enzyme
MPNWNELVIYELHIGTFSAQPGQEGTFEDAISRLDYLRDLGINAIEIMPAADFFTETSMGYNIGLPFAIDSAYGRSKALEQFIQEAHNRGIAVIMDVVYNHFGPQGLDWCLQCFDGWRQNGLDGIYFYSDGRERTDFGPRPDYGRSEVRQFLRDNVMMWLHDYRVDGLRYDSVVNIRRSDWGDNAEGWGLLQWCNDSKNGDQPWKIAIAEDLQNNDWITKPTGAGGAGFDAQWDSWFLGRVRDAIIPPSDAGRNMGAVAEAVTKSYNGSGPFQRIIYTESHDQAKDQRLTEAIWPGNAVSYYSRKRSTLGAALVLTSPGIPMIFMGQEFLEWGHWSDQSPLDWSKVQTYSGIVGLYRDLIRLRRNWYNNTRGLRGPNLNLFHVNDNAKVLAYHRWADGGPGDDVIVVANFSSTDFDSYNIGFPRPGTWYLRFNSDWQGYSTDLGNRGYDTTAAYGSNQNLPCNGNVGLGPYSAQILSQ